MMTRFPTLVLLSVLFLGFGCSQAPEEKADKADYHFKLASNFFTDKNPQTAIKELYTALEYNPGHAKAHHLLGFIYFGRRDMRRPLLTRARRLSWSAVRGGASARRVLPGGDVGGVSHHGALSTRESLCLVYPSAPGVRPLLSGAARCAWGPRCPRSPPQVCHSPRRFPEWP